MDSDSRGRGASTWRAKTRPLQRVWLRVVTSIDELAVYYLPLAKEKNEIRNSMKCMILYLQWNLGKQTVRSGTRSAFILFDVSVAGWTVNKPSPLLGIVISWQGGRIWYKKYIGHTALAVLLLLIGFGIHNDITLPLWKTSCVCYMLSCCTWRDTILSLEQSIRIAYHLIPHASKVLRPHNWHEEFLTDFYYSP